jgi:ubiquinone/menaquinone biosynthesis C-methylase UbiE
MERAEYDQMASLEGTMWWYRALHLELISRLDRAALGPNARVLDAGCGTGGFLKRLHDAHPALSLEGIELDEQAAAVARRKTGLAIVVGSVARMPFEAGSFSAIVSADVLCHANVDERAALSEFHRCLSPGGALLLNLPAYEWLASAHDDRVQNVRRYGARRASDLVRTAGFARVRVMHWNSLLFPLMLARRIMLGGGAARSDVRRFPDWQNRLLFAVTAAERRLSSAGVRLPFGGSVQVEAFR